MERKTIVKYKANFFDQLCSVPQVIISNIKIQHTFISYRASPCRLHHAIHPCNTSSLSFVPFIVHTYRTHYYRSCSHTLILVHFLSAFLHLLFIKLYSSSPIYVSHIYTFCFFPTLFYIYFRLLHTQFLFYDFFSFSSFFSSFTSFLRPLYSFIASFFSRFFICSFNYYPRQEILNEIYSPVGNVKRLS